MAKRGMFVYRSYNFVNKDPVVDAASTMIRQEGLKFNDVHKLSSCAASTIKNLFLGKTRSPRWTTIAAIASALGYNSVKISNGTVKFDKVRDINYKRELVKAAAEILKANEKAKRRRRRKPLRSNGHAHTGAAM